MRFHTIYIEVWEICKEGGGTLGNLDETSCPIDTETHMVLQCCCMGQVPTLDEQMRHMVSCHMVSCHPAIPVFLILVLDLAELDELDQFILELTVHG